MSLISKIIKKRSLKLFLKKLYFNTKRRPNRNQKKWFTEDGDNTYRLDYSLDSNSIFFEVGGYKRYYAKKIYNKFKKKITASLQSSHQLEWSFDYVWENWKLIK